MAKQDNNDFLGGGLKFNQAGVGSESNSTDSAPIIRPKPQTGTMVKTLIAIAGIIILIGILYFVNDFGFGGVSHTPGHGGVSGPGDHTIEPPKNF